MLSQRTANGTTLRESDANRRLIERAERLLQDLLGEGLRRGFHGTVSVELGIQDGTLQFVRRKSESIEK